VLVEFAARDVEHLQVAATGVAGPAQQKNATIGVREEGLDRVVSHKGRERHGVRAVTFEDFARVVLCRGTDIAAFGVQDHRYAREGRFDVRDQFRELFFCSAAREVSNLRLESTGEIRGGIDDRATERVDRVLAVAQVCRKSGWIGIKADAEQAVRGAPSRGKSIAERVHVRIVEIGSSGRFDAMESVRRTALGALGACATLRGFLHVHR